MHVFTVLFVNIRFKQYNVGFLSCEKYYHCGTISKCLCIAKKQQKELIFKKVNNLQYGKDP